MADPRAKVVIVGAGCFGISTAYHLLKRGFTNVTVLDRASTLPAPDAASNDMNRIVRSAYSDMFYANLAREAIVTWKDRDEWRDTYHESGVLVLGFSGNSYANEAYQNEVSLGARIQPLPNGESIRAMFSGVPIAPFKGQSGYLSSESGWANAGQGVAIMISKVIALNGKVLSGRTVRNIIRDGDGKTNGVECEDGTVYEASVVVIATGSWTPSTFPKITPRHTSGISTGKKTRQSIAMIQLTPEEAEVYQDCPVVLDFSSGFYVFPPTDKGIVKMAMHLAGYTHTKGGISTPRTVVSDPTGGPIPRHNLKLLRKHLRDVYPGLSEKPFSATRLCWYNDSPDGNWIIGHAPGDESLVIATAGSGHAYKFLPVIGRLVADVIDGTIEPSVAAKLAVERQYTDTDDSRRGMEVAELNLDDLCTPGDLLETNV